MVSITIGVEYREGSLSVTSKTGCLTLDDDGIGYQESGGTRRTWAWPEVRLGFDPPEEEAVDRGGVAKMLALAGLRSSKIPRPGLRLVADGAEIGFELPNVEGDVHVIAAHIVKQFTASAGRVSVRDQRVL